MRKENYNQHEKQKAKSEEIRKNGLQLNEHTLEHHH
jgi:hypothetical protein